MKHFIIIALVATVMTVSADVKSDYLTAKAANDSVKTEIKGEVKTNKAILAAKKVIKEETARIKEELNAKDYSKAVAKAKKAFLDSVE